MSPLRRIARSPRAAGRGRRSNPARGLNTVRAQTTVKGRKGLRLVPPTLCLRLPDRLSSGQLAARPWRGKADDMKYLHTMVRISDIDASLHFYCNLLGLRETR